MLTVNQFTLVPELIAKSDLITAIPERILKRVLFRAVAYCRITDRSRISRIANDVA